MPLFISIALFATFASATVQLLLADAIAVKESKGQLLPIPKRFVRFLRDYKGEITKIVWPGPKAVVKNTLIVLGMCLLFGAFVWLVDWGLGSLIGLLIK
jgi:preprotein translocase subunit SecE